MFALSEANTQWIIDCLSYLKRNGHDTIEADAEAQKQWTNQIRVMADATIYVLENSWYMGSNVPGKPRVFVCHMDFPKYIEECRRSQELNYHGFHTQSAAGEHRRG
jgi:cyclohexanone monooxygenase